MSKKILLIGGAGYIGSVLTEKLLGKNYNVVCFDSLIYSQKFCVEPFLKKKNYKFIFGDIRNISKHKDLLNDVSDVIILAGLVGDPITKKYPNESEKINYISIKSFLKKCVGKKLNKVIFVSTCSNYGLIKKNKIADENYKLKPLSNYAKQKVKIEKYIMSLKGKIDYKPTILRFATAFGLSPRMRFDLTLNEFVKDACNNKKVVVYDADTWRPYCHVKDFSRLIEIVLNSNFKKTSFQIFNAGNEKNNLTKRMLINKILKITKKGKVEFLKHGFDTRNYRVNFSKVKRILGFKTKFNIDYGIKEIIKFLKSPKYKNFKTKQKLLGNYSIKQT